MTEIEVVPHPKESIDSYACRAWADSEPPPPSARAAQLERYVEEIERLHRRAVTAGLLLKQEAKPAAMGALLSVVAEIEDGLEDLQRRRKVLLPNVRHIHDNIDAVNAIGSDAQGPIYNIEALLGVISHRVERGADGHLITLCEMCIAEIPKLRFALYGEEMGL